MRIAAIVVCLAVVAGFVTGCVDGMTGQTFNCITQVCK